MIKANLSNAGPAPAVVLLLTALTVALPSHAQDSCVAQGLGNPYSNDVYGVMEWEGHFYDAGWFHLRRRPSGGGNWDSFGGGISGGGAYTFAESMLIHEDQLVVGGAFTTAGGIPVGNICTWNGSEFGALGTGLNAEVNAIVEWQGQLVAGGEFTANGRFEPMEHIALFDADTDRWVAMGDGLGGVPIGYSSAIWGLAVHRGDLYATGRFTASGSQVLNGVARWNAGRDRWEPLGSGIPNMGSGNVGTAITSWGGLLWVSGWFSHIGGVRAPWMATWDGQVWAPVPPGPTRHSLTFREWGGSLYASGPFPFTLSGREWDIARFDGTSWHGVGSSDSNWPNDIRPTAAGDALIVGGYFSWFEGVFTGNYLTLECEDIFPCELDLRMDDVPAAVEPGDVVSLVGWVSNPCDTERTFDEARWAVTSPVRRQFTLYSGPSVTLQDGAAVAEELAVPVPAEAPRGVYTVSFELLHAGEVLDVESFEVQVGGS